MIKTKIFLLTIFTLLAWSSIEAAEPNISPVCGALKNYPRKELGQMSFEKGELSAICRPFTKYTRAELDRCGNPETDPYTSKFTWPTRLEMSKRGKGNLLVDQDLRPERDQLMKHIEELRASSTRLCCGEEDHECVSAMKAVKVELCQPNAASDKPDPCVFGGSYRMPSAGYTDAFKKILNHYSAVDGLSGQIKKLASRNLIASNSDIVANQKEDDSQFSGSIVLTSYVSRKSGLSTYDPVILHEFGHACSMVKMRSLALQGEHDLARAERATEWLDQTKYRCQPDLAPSKAYFDFWQSLGETREFAQCLNDIAVLNQKHAVDKPCPSLCPGHYLEESVGIAFSMLTGDLSGHLESVFPNTCDHTRDAQHPLVSDVVDCLAQHSQRFRERVKQAYQCQS